MKGEESTFKLYISEEVDSVEANRLMTFMKDGGFLDFQTDEVMVEIITLNSNLNIFAIFVFTFKWQNGGKILWDYDIKSVPVYLYQDDNRWWRILLEVLCVIFLVVECVKELIEMVWAIKMFQIWKYICDIWNFLDIIHFFIMWSAWALWLNQNSMAANLNMPTRFNILKSPSQDAKGRLFLTMPEGEFQFLEFQKYLKDMMQNLALYNVLVSTSVILFVLRVLKDADFQPKIALVTRTIANVFSDLAHFFLLFAVVVVGYAIAGTLLFGHQYDGFSTLSNSFFYLLILLIAFNPDEGWVQMNHAAPDWAFSIYIWTWILIALFILLNIFLAILINGYSAMQSGGMSDPEGILTEVYEIIVHEMKRVIKLFRKDYRFISNEELAFRLSSFVSSAQFDDTLEQYKQITLAGLMEIKSSSGTKLTTPDVYHVLKLYFPDQVLTAQSDVIDLYLDPALRNLMRRFGKMVQAPPTKDIRKEQIEMFKRRMELETMKRIAMTDLSMQEKVEPASYGSNGELIHTRIYYSILSVIIEQMKNLPKMDVFRGADPYCVIFLEGAPGLFQTEVRRGMREADWTWDPSLSENFQWEIPNSALHLMPDRKLVVMIYDKDQFSNDDLIGCVTVGLKELDADGIFDGWKMIVRPPNASQTQFFWYRPPIGEVKLRVCLATVNHTADSDSESFTMQNHRPIKPMAPTRFSLASTLGFPVNQTPCEQSLLNTDILKPFDANGIPENSVPRPKARAALANLRNSDDQTTLGHVVSKERNTGNVLDVLANSAPFASRPGTRTRSRYDIYPDERIRSAHHSDIDTTDTYNLRSGNGSLPSRLPATRTMSPFLSVQRPEASSATVNRDNSRRVGGNVSGSAVQEGLPAASSAHRQRPVQESQLNQSQLQSPHSIYMSR
uniref:C2 domain-containing protein n=1 Tax=Cryptomonas curvata TaxID=233186 RepID=A0A7S0MD93_9CRYP